MAQGPAPTTKEPISTEHPSGSPGWIRTSDHSINSRMLYR
jgi:hypothetical protein